MGTVRPGWVRPNRGRRGPGRRSKRVRGFRSVWSAVGSSNFDQRSVLFNDEVDAIVLGEQTAREIRATLARDLRDSRRIDRADWEDRPFGQKIREYFARVWESLL
mgnify:CR=1 FL=1